MAKDKTEVKRPLLNDYKRVVQAIRETLWPGGDADFEWSADTVQDVADILERNGMGPKEAEVMSDYSNEDRAERASATLTYYKTEIMKEVCEQNSAEIADLITDLLHLTRLWDQGDDPIESTIRVARMNFEAEEEEEEESANDDE